MSIFNGRNQCETILWCVIFINFKGLLLYEVVAERVVPESVVQRLYEMYRDAFNDDAVLSRRRMSTSDTSFDIHVRKLKEVNGDKPHNLYINQSKRNDKQLFYIVNPLEAKISNSFLSIDEFRNLLDDRAVRMRADFSQGNSQVHRLPRPKNLRINIGYLSKGKVTPKILVRAYYSKVTSTTSATTKKRKVARAKIKKIRVTSSPVTESTNFSSKRIRLKKIKKRKILRKRIKTTTEATTDVVNSEKKNKAIKMEIAEDIQDTKEIKVEQPKYSSKIIEETPVDIAEEIIESKIDKIATSTIRDLGADDIIQKFQSKISLLKKPLHYKPKLEERTLAYSYMPDFDTEKPLTYSYKPKFDLKTPSFEESMKGDLANYLTPKPVERATLNHRFQVKSNRPDAAFSDDVGQSNNQALRQSFVEQPSYTTSKQFTRYTPDRSLLSQYIPDMDFDFISTSNIRRDIITLSDYNPKKGKGPSIYIQTQKPRRVSTEKFLSEFIPRVNQPAFVNNDYPLEKYSYINRADTTTTTTTEAPFFSELTSRITQNNNLLTPHEYETTEKSELTSKLLTSTFEIVDSDFHQYATTDLSSETTQRTVATKRKRLKRPMVFSAY